MPLLNIDPNIKKHWLPFSFGSKVETPTIFTFRKSDTKDGSDRPPRLRICPSQNIIEKMLDGDSPGCDVAHRLLFPKNSSGETLGFDEILNNIPAIQIREFLQDSRINEIQNLFAAFTKGMKFFDENKDKKPNVDKEKLVEKLRTIVSDSVKGFADLLNEPTMGYVGGNIGPSGNSTEYAYVMSIPYLLYTKLIASTTQNYYILPYNGRLVFDTDGTYGYGGTGGLKGWSMDGSSIIGKLMNFVGASVRVDTTPRFSASGDSATTTITVNLDLFNDSYEGTVANFIMINTLFPGNMWMQYHFFNVAPNLYDIKVDGFQRLYMCTGQFKCDYKGALRTPSEYFLRCIANNYIIENGGMNDKSKLAKTIQDVKNNLMLIKIPDVYSLTLTFKSLLPNNMNSYLWQFTQENNVTNYNNGKPRDGFGSGDDDNDNPIKQFTDSVNAQVKDTMKAEGLATEDDGGTQTSGGTK